MSYLLFSTVPEDGLTLLVGFRPLPTRAYTMLVPKFEKHPIFAKFGRKTLQLCHNERGGVPNHQPHDCLLNYLFRRRSKKTSKLRVTGLFEGNSPVAREFPAQRPSNAENVSI